MNMQNVAKLDISEGDVKTIHDKDGNLIWGKVSYDVKYKGDTAQNGTPTPSAPVAVQTVTGEQTISINSAAHTVDLGSIELCKIGIYQDYIYKSGGKWYVHKECGKAVFDGTESWTKVAMQYSDGYVTSISDIEPAPGSASSARPFMSSFFKATTANESWATQVGSSSMSRNSSKNVRFSKGEAKNSGDLDAWRAWVSSVSLTIYYPLADSIDTEIIGQTLITQLEAVARWMTRYGYNATVSGNLPIIIDRTAL